MTEIELNDKSSMPSELLIKKMLGNTYKYFEEIRNY